MTQNKEKSIWRVSVLIGTLLIGGLWGGDLIYRLIPKEPNGIIIAEGQFKGAQSKPAAPDVPAPAAPAGTPAPQPQDDGSMRIQDAVTGAGVQGIPKGCVTVPQDEIAVRSGILLQLDASHPFTGSAGTMCSFADKNEYYRLKNMDLQTKPEVVSGMNVLAELYRNATGKADLMIYSTTAAYGADKSLYPDELPDRACGYCVDLCILNDDGSISKITEPIAWIEENAYTAGFVPVYTEALAESQGVAAAPYHLRYVGPVHAGIMHNEGLTLYQYFSALHDHTIASPYYYNDGTQDYSVYYVPAETGKATEVPVPLGSDYTISGNNSDGYVVLANTRIG
ncbi:MAG: D-alanyl-D-alanine carboxypeptidase family protein [Oscillospiraceae bacterium]|nr:D-alanyl-D-alanine carboxypeptidase family protein [Oscillospiraceae bacterium]